MKNIIKATLVSLAFLVTMACGGESEAISVVKKGSLNKCSYYTVEEVVNSFLEKPKWKHTVDKNGVDYVNISGFTANGKPANVVMQFWVRKNEFGLQSLEIDKEAQNNIFGISILIDTMCKSAREAAKEKLSKIRVIPAEPINDSRDGKNYKTVKIGNQTWMAENLNIKMGKSLCYENKDSNCNKYGRLYDLETAMKSCPSGWHLPTKIEWAKLTGVAGGDDNAGRYLKATSGWNNNGNGEDKLGFSALPGGNGYSDGAFDDVGFNGLWWSASRDLANYDYYWSMHYHNESVSWNRDHMGSLVSVRCVKDENQTTKAKKEEELSKANIIPAEPLKDSLNSKKEEKPNKANIILTELLKDSRNGKNYKTVKIGTQTWMAENLNYNADGSKCYNNSENNCQKYGRLYNWATAINACPNGWQLPSNAEWDALYRFVDGTSGTSSPYESETAGKYLKAASGWNNGGNGTDTYGFAALPGGLGNPDGSFSGADDFGYWWDASEHNAKNAYRRSILHSDERAYWRHGSKSNLLSVRCIKEEKTEAEAKAMEELELEAKKWQESDCWKPYKSIEGKYFTFKGTAKRYAETGACDVSWTATSKIIIGNCPNKSVWKMTTWGEEGKSSGENEIPTKCKSITPKIITNHNYNEFE